MYKVQKVNELVRQELGKIILEQEEFGAGVLPTLMSVETSADLRHANVTISVFPTAQGGLVLKKLTARVFGLQQLLNKKLKMHPVPKIRFVLNHEESESQEIEELLEKIKEDDL